MNINFISKSLGKSSVQYKVVLFIVRSRELYVYDMVKVWDV